MKLNRNILLILIVSVMVSYAMIDQAYAVCEPETKTPDPTDPSNNKLMCELVQGGEFYTDNGEGHCIVP